MRKITLAAAFFALASAAYAQGTFPLNNLPLGKGPGKTGWTALAPGSNGNCLVVTGGAPTFTTCTATPAAGTNGQIQYNNAGAFGGFTPGGDLSFSVPNFTIVNNAVTNAKLATATQNTVKGAATSTAVADLTMPSCSTATSVLQWTTNTGFGCASNPVGTVTSAGVTNTYGLSISGSPITTSGNISEGVALTTTNNSIGANVLLNNTGTYQIGPQTAQGSTGTWCGGGTVTVSDSSASSSNINIRMTDGTTVIASTAVTTQSGNPNARISASLWGCIASPAANIRIEANDSTATTGTMYFNQSGNSKDGTLTMFRVQ